MKNKTFFMIANTSFLLCSFAAPTFAFADGNIAEKRTVTSRGEFFTGGDDQSLKTDLSTLTDGIVFKRGHNEDQGSVWWEETEGSEHFLKIFLGPNTYKINKIAIQVDSSDDYVVSWDDKRTEYLATNPQKIVIVPDRTVSGMAPPVIKKINAITDAFTIEHDPNGEGDGLYSVSEFQAFGGKGSKRENNKDN